jgi:beta-lactamase regulating signal transducer with metallopeptidase domain
MNALRLILESGWAWRIGWMLLHSLWLGGVTAALLCAGMVILRRRSPSVRYLAACAALALLVLGTAAAFFLAGGAGPVADARPPIATAPAPPPRLPAMRPSGIQPAEKRAAAPLSTPQRQGPALPARISQALAPALPWIALAWMVGVVAMSTWHLLGWVGARRIRRLSALPDLPGAAETLARLARAMHIRRPVQVLQSALMNVPAVVGWLKPVILLPVSAGTGLSPWQIEAILAHELAHIRRHDYLVNLLQSVVETLLFYHPAVWYISRRIRAERENCCDDAAVELCGDSAAYVEALVAAVAQARRPRRAVAASGADLLPRVRRILGVGQEGRARPTLLSAAIAMTLLAAALLPVVRTSTASPQVPPNASFSAGTGPSTRPSQAAGSFVRDLSVDERSVLALFGAMREKVPPEWIVGGMNMLSKRPIPAWSPAEANAFSIELYIKPDLMRTAPRGKALNMVLYLVEPAYEGKPKDMPEAMRKVATRELGSWRGWKVLLMGEGSATGWNTCDVDLKTILKESESAPTDEKSLAEGQLRARAEMLRRAAATTRPAP